MAPDRRSQPGHPAANIGQTGSGRGGGWVERGSWGKTTLIEDFPNYYLVKMLPLLTPALGGHSSQVATLTSKSRKPKTSMKVIL